MKAQSRHPANVEAGKSLKSAVHKTCKNSGSQGLEIPACQNEPSGVPKSDDYGTKEEDTLLSPRITIYPFGYRGSAARLMYELTYFQLEHTLRPANPSA